MFVGEPFILLPLFTSFLVVQQLYQHAHDYANLSDRSCPSIADLAMSCHDIGLTPSKLKATSVKHARKSKKRRTSPFFAFAFV